MGKLIRWDDLIFDLKEIKFIFPITNQPRQLKIGFKSGKAQTLSFLNYEEVKKFLLFIEMKSKE